MKPFSTYPEDRKKLLALAAAVLADDNAMAVPEAVELADLVSAILTDEVFVMPQGPASKPTADDDADYYRPDASGYSRADEEWFFDSDGKP